MTDSPAPTTSPRNDRPADAFATVAGDGPLRVILVGAGGMGRNWLSVLSASPDTEVVGLVDLDLETATAALVDAGLAATPTGTSVAALARHTGAQAVVNVTVPAAHHPVNVEALFAGLPVLCEKPAAPTVSQALSLAGAAEASGQLLMISQSRRYFNRLARFRDAARSLGDIGLVTTDFFKAPHFGGFREEMGHVLLVDMAIHAFDAARYLLDRDPVAVYCEEFNPSWSWYRGAAAATAVFEFEEGVRFVYTGSWCSPGLETSWNGAWRISGAGGSGTWDGEGDPVVEGGALPPSSGASDPAPEEIAGSLAEFVRAVRTGVTPSGEVHSNVLSLAMVEAAVRSAGARSRVTIHEVLEDAYAGAVAAERHPAIAASLRSWGDVESGLRGVVGR